jgi:hypothetical protein
VPAALAAANANWNAGGSILTFYFPVGLFVVIAVLLYLQLSRPHKVPGHRQLATSERSCSPARPAQGSHQRGVPLSAAPVTDTAYHKPMSSA